MMFVCRERKFSLLSSVNDPITINRKIILFFKLIWQLQKDENQFAGKRPSKHLKEVIVVIVCTFSLNNESGTNIFNEWVICLNLIRMPYNRFLIYKDAILTNMIVRKRDTLQVLNSGGTIQSRLIVKLVHINSMLKISNINYQMDNRQYFVQLGLEIPIDNKQQRHVVCKNFKKNVNFKFIYFNPPLFSHSYLTQPTKFFTKMASMHLSVFSLYALEIISSIG